MDDAIRYDLLVTCTLVKHQQSVACRKSAVTAAYTTFNKTQFGAFWSQIGPSERS